MILEWALLYCKDAKYMLKVDDDVFLYIGLLKADLISENYSNSIIGCIVRNLSQFRFPLSKWYLSRDQYSAVIFHHYTRMSRVTVSVAAKPSQLDGQKCHVWIKIESLI